MKLLLLNKKNKNDNNYGGLILLREKKDQSNICRQQFYEINSNGKISGFIINGEIPVVVDTDKELPTLLIFPEQVASQKK